MPFRVAVKALGLVAVNCVLFLGYRLLFLHEFAGPGAAGRSTALLHGLRLDVALLGLAWGFTYVNALSLVANFFFFRERNQHLWEMLLANLGRPEEVYVAIEPFLDFHPFFVVGLLAGTVACVVLARRDARSVAGPGIDVWRRKGALAATLAVALVGLATNLEPVADQDGDRAGTTASKYYMDLPDYVVNQAVVNPMFDLLHYYVPSLFAKRRYRLQAPEAIEVSRTLLDLSGSDARYPLLQTIDGSGALGIENVVLLQVEGLGTNVLEQRAGDEWVMPYVHELAEQGLYFPNVIQSFSATDGSTFATATSLHRTFGPTSRVSHFQPNEVNGHYGSLSRILGSSNRHNYFFAAFKQRSADFLSFMANQGYDAHGYTELLARLGPRADTDANNLGIYDGPMLRQVADVLIATPGRFTAYVATATSHSPWQVPADMPAEVAHAGLNTFRYTDRSIRAFVETLRARRPDFDRTLFVVFGDHTSITFGDGLTERLRVPLILYNTRLARERGRWTDRTTASGSHVDILPTVLGLLDEPHPYAGMGRNLLGAQATGRGIVSSTYMTSFYIRDGFALRYVPYDRGGVQLFAVVDGDIVTRDVSAEHPDVLARLTREHLALYETADRLVRDKHVFPVGAAADGILAAAAQR